MKIANKKTVATLCRSNSLGSHYSDPTRIEERTFDPGDELTRLNDRHFWQYNAADFDDFFEFNISEVNEKHAGISASRYRTHVATVRAKSSQEAPGVFAKSKGFEESAAIRWFATTFRIGSQEYELTPVS